jgi:putative salt-induced outer membrane protein YdiY
MYLSIRLMITTASRLMLAGLLAVVVLPVGADELLMKDGSRLLGKVIRKEDDTLEFETGYAGVIRVKWTEVSELHSEEPVRVLLDDEAIVSASTIRNTDAATVLETGPDQQPDTVAPEKVAYINPAPWRMGEGVRWTGRINIDLELERGNSEEDEFNLDGETRFRRKNDRLTISGQYEEDSTEGVVTTRKWRELNKYDYFITDKLYYGALLGFEHDKFSDLDLRTSVGPHVGYQFFESRERNLDVDVGALYVDENNEEADDDQRWSLGWSIDFDWFLLPDRIQFYHRHVGLQDVSEKDNLVIDSWTGFRFPIYAGIVASTEAEIDYDGGVSGDIDKTDTTYRFKLGYQW